MSNPDSAPLDPPSSDSRPLRRPLPAAFYSFRSLLWAWALPQALMLFCNLGAWAVVSGDASAENSRAAFFLAAANAGCIVIGAALAFFPKRPFGALAACACELFLMAYFAWVMILFSKAVPDGVSPWMLSELAVGLNIVFCTFIPGVFVGLRACEFKIGKNYLRDFLVSVASAAAFPVLIYIGGATLFRLFEFVIEPLENALPESVFVFIVAFLFACVGFVICIGIGRALIVLYIASGKYRYLEWFSMFAFCLALPALGLYMNDSLGGFPYPMNFRICMLMTLANCAVLAIPVSGNARANFALFVAGCALYSFVCYVALIFIPFIPFAIPLIFMGVGFVLISPAALFVFSSMKLSRLFRSLPCRKSAVAAGIMAFLAIPAFITAQSFYYRRHLERGLNYVESADTSSPRRTFGGDAAAVAGAAEWMFSYKRGEYLPFITPLRMWILCDGMVLPDSKLRRIYGAFTGRDFDADMADAGRLSGPLNAFGTSFRQASGILPPGRNVEVEKFSVCESLDGVADASVLAKPKYGGAQELYARISMPEGVFLSGMEFPVEGVVKRANVVEKKAALWTYENIVAEGRDPAIAFYLPDGDVALRAFPVPVNGAEIGLEFVCLPGFSATGIEIRASGIDSAAVCDKPSAPSSAGSSGFFAWEDFSVASVPESPAASEFAFARRPYYALVIDRSYGGFDPALVESALDALRAANPGVGLAKLYLSNLNFEPAGRAEFDAESGKWKMSGFTGAAEKFPAAGGFDFATSLLLAMRDYEAALDSGSLEDAEAFPVLVFLTRSKPPAEIPNPYAALVPEMRGPGFLAFDGSGPAPDVAGAADLSAKSAILRSGDALRPVPLGRPSVAVFPVSGGGKRADAAVLVPRGGGEGPALATARGGVSGKAAAAARLFALSGAAARNPSLKEELFPEIVKLSKASGIMARETSLIVVETSSQERIMALAEKKAMSSNKSLSFGEEDEVFGEVPPPNMPEPCAWLAALLAAAAVYAASRLAGARGQRLF